MIICTFLSTLSLRRATVAASTSDVSDRISIHALLAESDVTEEDIIFEEPMISIHALLAESDSTSLTFPGFGMISIHALLAESDAAGHLILTAQ